MISRTWSAALATMAIAGGSVLVATQHPPAPASRPETSTLTRPSSPASRTDTSGFLRRWLLLEPIKVSGQLTDGAVRATVEKEYFPNQLTVVPHDGDKMTVGDQSLV